MPDLSAIRLREDAPDVRWVLFIDGIEFAWTNDNGQGLGTLLGSGGSTWMGLSEASIGGVEVAGARTVLGGLEMPSSFGEGIDEKSGEPIPKTVSFRLHDEDDTLSQLFGRENKTFDLLGERIGSGTTALAATALGQAGDAIPIWGRNVGLERVGAAGQRHLFPCLPESLVGLEHSVLQDASGPDALPPILVSDEPILWAGRTFTLYLIYRDIDDTTADASAWPTWDDQDTAGNRMLFGKVIGVRRQAGRIWELQCHGRDGLSRKQLGRVTTGEWMPMSTELAYETDEDGIAIHFAKLGSGAGLAPTDTFDSLTFGGTTLTGTTKADLVVEIDDLIQDVFDGTTSNDPGSVAVPSGDLIDWEQNLVPQQPRVGFLGGSPAKFYVGKIQTTALLQQHLLIMVVAMHAKVWRQLGFEPETQDFETPSQPPDDEAQIKFYPLESGTEYGTGPNPKSVFPSGADVPAGGYWAARFTSVALGAIEDLSQSEAWDNNANDRFYKAKFLGEPFTLNMEAADQLVRLGGANPFIEGQLTAPVSGDDVDGTAGEFARYFAIRGKVLTQPEEDPVDTVQVALMEWADANYGTVSPGNGAQPAFILKEWMDPRLFGFDNERLTGLEYWTGVAGDEGQIDAVPLNAYAYMNADVPEYVHQVWGQILLSTGSGLGLSIGIIDEGDNSPGLALQLRWQSDIELADLGCAIPYQLVASAADIRAVFDGLPGGYQGPLQRSRYAYIGPFLAQDALLSIMRPRRLMWSYHGDVLGVVRLVPFSPLEADVSILEADLYGDDDPRTLMPGQAPSPVGALDGIELAYRWQPDSSKLREEHRVLARDAEASARTGELIEKVIDHGLLDIQTAVEVGSGQWLSDFNTLWATQAAEFFAQDHYSITLTVSRPKGQDLRPGTRVLLTNPWPADNAGGYGLTDHVGIVTSRDVNTKTHATRVEVFVFAGQGLGWRYFGPIARVTEQAGAVLTLSSDQYGHGVSVIADGDALEAPSFTSASNTRSVLIVYRIGETWQTDGPYTVSSWDSATNLLTLGSTPTTSIEYADRWVILDNFDDQSVGSYPQAILGAVVQDDLTHGTGPTVGRQFLP